MGKLVFGVGVNDVANARSRKHADPLTIKAYHLWAALLQRCYEPKSLAKNVHYNDVTVCEAWLTFSNFKAWFDINYVEGYEIDKDILSMGTAKEYSPDTCAFVPKKFNQLILSKRANIKAIYTGVTLLKGRNKAYSAKGMGKTIGYFYTPEEAHRAYCEYKVGYLHAMAKELHLDARVADKLRSLTVQDFLEC